MSELVRRTERTTVHDEEYVYHHPREHADAQANECQAGGLNGEAMVVDIDVGECLERKV